MKDKIITLRSHGEIRFMKHDDEWLFNADNNGLSWYKLNPNLVSFAELLHEDRKVLAALCGKSYHAADTSLKLSFSPLDDPGRTVMSVGEAQEFNDSKSNLFHSQIKDAIAHAMNDFEDSVTVGLNNKTFEDAAIKATIEFMESLGWKTSKNFNRDEHNNVKSVTISWFSQPSNED